MAAELETPLFPLRAVLFPGGVLPLRVFEPRYLDMVSRCLKQGEGFGVSLIQRGREVGAAATPFKVGTLVSIRDWHQGEDGLLGILVQGLYRFVIHATSVLPDQLVMARVEPLPEASPQPVPSRFLPMVDLLREMLSKVNLGGDMPVRFGDANWVGCRLAELLPLPLARKQYLLQLNDPAQRLDRLCEMLRCLSDVD